MGSNFNLVKKTEKEEDDDIIEDDDNFEEDEAKENTSRNKNNNVKSNMMKYMVIFIAVFFGLLMILWLVSLMSHRTYTYGQVEEVLKSAAQSYFKDYPESLPQEDGSIVEVDYTNLVAAEKMKDLSEYLGENTTCTGSVQVEKSSSGYLYTPYLNCGDSYTTTELYKVVESQSVVTSGYGLYNQNGTYAFRGEKVNNYVQLGTDSNGDANIWRIVKVTSDNNIVLIKEEQTGSTVPYDDRYNQERGWSSGINLYSASRLKDYSETIYSNPNEDLNEVVLTKKYKKYIVDYNLCTGKRSVEETGTANTSECATVQENTKYGMLTVSDYMNASIDTNCTTALSKSCGNYNYLKVKFSWWLSTANSANSYEAYSVGENGIITSDNTCNYAYLRPVVYLNSKVMYGSGKGTEKSPYKLK